MEAAQTAAVEIWFYHLERSSVEETLPPLLEKCVQKGWRALVRTKTQAQVTALDTKLWTYKPNAWLPHAVESGQMDQDQRQPILLANDAGAKVENAHHVQALFLLDQTGWAGVSGLERIFVLFDGRDEEAVHHARQAWRASSGAGFQPSYWKQNEAGKWARTA